MCRIVSGDKIVSPQTEQTSVGTCSNTNTCPSRWTVWIIVFRSYSPGHPWILHFMVSPSLARSHPFGRLRLVRYTLLYHFLMCMQRNPDRIPPALVAQSKHYGVALLDVDVKHDSDDTLCLSDNQSANSVTSGMFSAILINIDGFLPAYISHGQEFFISGES